MDKENGDGADGGGKQQDGLLDAAGLFGAYWGRDGSSGGGAAAQAQAQAQAQAALFGFGSRYPQQSTLGVAANQAASLGIHPAASAAWWSMASHLAAQDYLARLQASGLSFPPLTDPYSALSALSGQGLKQTQKQNKQPARNERSARTSTSSSSSAKDKIPATSSSNSQPSMRSSYGFPKTSSPSTMHSQGSLSSLASLNSLVSSPHQSNKPSSKQSQMPQQRGKSSSSSSSGKGSDRDLALLRGDLMLAQAAAHGAYHAAVAAAAKGKNMSPLYPFGMPGSDKDRHGGIDSLTGLPHTILSAALEGGDPASVLGGVRLPPDTEIIKYTSSLAGPKAPPGTTNRGRKKTISLDPPQVSVHPSTGDRGTPLPSKRQKVDEYGNSRSSVEVIRLPNKPDGRPGHNSLAGTPPPNLSDYAGISRELLQTIASQSGVSLAALERQLAGTTANASKHHRDPGLNLSTKSNNTSTEDSPLDLGVKSSSSIDEDAPLNLSLKPTPPSTQASDALSRLTSLSSSLNAASNDRISRRKPGAKPRRVAPELNSTAHESPRPKSSGSEDSECWPSREGRPRNLGRGVSKPKKNTVASLLAQSRALGLRPALAQQLLGETDLEKLKALLGEAASTDSECPSDSCPSDSDTSDTGRRPHDAQLRLPLALGWKRVTVIKGLSRSCCIKGDVTYTPPDPHAALTFRSAHEVHAFLEANPCGPLCTDNFSWSARLVLGEYLQPAPDGAEPLVLNEGEINKRLEEARALAALTGPRPTPPPVDRRIELARRQQAARDARRDASARSRDQARLVRELERTEKAELAKREKEARSQQLLEHINKNRTQLTIEPLPSVPKPITDSEWKIPEIVMGPASKMPKDRTMPPISLSLIPVSGPKDQSSPIKTIQFDQTSWKETEQYNALDKMKDFAEKAAFDLPKRPKEKYFDFSLMKSDQKSTVKENNLEKLIESYSRITEFINGCDWSKLQSDKKAEDPKSLEQKYLSAKNEFMSENLSLMPKDSQKSVLKDVIDLSEDDDNILTDIITKKISRGTFNIGKDGALSISVHPYSSSAKKRKQEEIEKQKYEEQAKRQQERELKRHQAILLKEQERERRRQHTTFIRQLDSRRRWEERERRKHQNLLDRLLAKEKKLQSRRKEMELLSELRRPQEDSSLSDQKPLPTLSRIPGLQLPGQAMADILQVYEFIHNFGQTLGFDLDSMPTLDTLQMALIPSCSSEPDEAELIQVLTQLLVCAIEDPGIPHPGRHTTLLGHAIRMGDITPANLSEVLRIYLYANATGEVKVLTGLTAERERERRVADHHQTNYEMECTQANSKNAAYYEHLHDNATYKLSDALRDKPFLALNATTKARILAFLCDELLQNKSVLRQLDGSLDHLNQLKKERYLMDMKIRKVRVLHQRKVRTEQSERQQALALERMQKLVEESTANLSRTSPQSNEDDHLPSEKSETPKKEESEDDKITPLPSPYKDNATTEDEKELSPLKDLSNNMKTKEMLNNNKDECSPADNSKLDKDSVMGDCDAILSDLESEGTQPEEDEDKNLSSEELARKLEKLLRQSEQQLQQLAAGSHALRATCYGQDRYWRRYWSLGKCGGVFVEALESAQPEIMQYQQALQDRTQPTHTETNKRKKKGAKEKKEPPPPPQPAPEPEKDTREETEALKKEEALKSEIELKNIKSELNLSDHTQIIKYEPNVKHGACKVEGSIKMEEKYIQQKQTNEEQDMLDIEDSIPTAFLVQKPTHTPMYAAQAEPVDKPQEIVKIENIVKSEEKPEPEEKDQLVNNLEELRKMAEAVSSQLDAAKKAEQEVKEENDEKEVKQEVMEAEAGHALLYTKTLEGKWFSILRHESSFLSNIHEVSEDQKMPNYCDNEHTCAEVVSCQGHKWDVSNNLHLLSDPSLFTLNSMVTSVQVPSNNVYADSSLTMSGLDQELMDSSLSKEPGQDIETEEDNKEQDNDLEKELQADALKHDINAQKAKASSLTSLGLLNFNALSTYVTCDSPPPIQMSPEELDQLEHCKAHGMPKKIEGNFVPKELRYGWWRITDPEQLKDLMDSLHPRGVRERELHTSLVQHVPTVNNKLYIDQGDAASTEFEASHQDRVFAQSGGYPPPDPPGSFSTATAYRVDYHVLEMVEQLEERVSAASMQMKGWRPARYATLPAHTAQPTPADLIARAKHKLSSVEAHIERRYLKPPLVQSTAEAAIGAVLQAEHGNAPAQSTHNSDSANESKAEGKGISRGLATWREALSRCNTSAQIAMVLQALEAAVAWDKSIMKANCQFCLSGDNEDQLLLCDGCDKGYHTYCFKPRMDKIPEGDWYCWECVNKARGERVCIVCGGAAGGRTIPCALCVRAYHQDCHYPPLGKNPRGKWYCTQCISRAPPKKPRNTKKRDSKLKGNDSLDGDQNMVPSPAPSHASTSTTAEECSASILHTPEKPDSADKMDEQMAETENGLNHHTVAPPDFTEDGPPPEKRRALQFVGGNGALPEEIEPLIDSAPIIEEREAEAAPLVSRAKKEKNSAKKVIKELQFCKSLLGEMECHEHAWPFLLPVNTKQFPQYKKVIRCPMDMATIKRKIQDSIYKCKEEFASDVRLIFSNCEVFNEDDSPVGRAGHNMRQFFEERWERA